MFGIFCIGLGIVVFKIFPVWYPGLVPFGFGIAILIFDFWVKYQIIKYVDEQMKPIDELKDKIIKEINDQTTKEKEGISK